MRTLPFTRKFDGRDYVLYISRVTKETAQQEAKKLRRSGLLARVTRTADGKYNTYGSNWNNYQPNATKRKARR